MTITSAPEAPFQIERALDDRDAIFAGFRQLDKKFCALRRELSRVRERLAALVPDDDEVEVEPQN